MSECHFGEQLLDRISCSLRVTSVTTFAILILPMTKRPAPSGLSTCDLAIALLMRVLWMATVFVGVGFAVTQIYGCGSDLVSQAMVHGSGEYNMPVEFVLVSIVQGAGLGDDGFGLPPTLNRREPVMTGVSSLDADRDALPLVNGVLGAGFRHMDNRLVNGPPVLAEAAVEHSTVAMASAFPAAPEHAAKIVVGAIPLAVAAYDIVALRVLRARFWGSMACGDFVDEPVDALGVVLLVP